jgi:hypothetical protein
VSALIKEDSNRSEVDIKLLISIIKVFFKDKGELELYEIAKHTQYECHNEGETIFKYGSVGDKFYLILRGEVSCQIPRKTKLLSKETTVIG